MKEQIHTIPVAEAFAAEDECPFCYLHRQMEQRAIRYFAGPSASYMEPSVRAITNQHGFCPDHMQKLYDYGNPLGCALMVQTYYESVLLQLRTQLENRPQPAKKGLLQRKKLTSATPIWEGIQQQVDDCAICRRVEESMQRQYRVFFSLLKDAQFRCMVENSKGFCMHHFALLLQEAHSHLPGAYEAWFYDTVYGLMEENLLRVKADLDHLISKYDYRNADLPWDNARDALQRAMQKMAGIYPADQPYRKE